MSKTEKSARAMPEPDRSFGRQLREMNDALLVSSVRQHELTERAVHGEAAAARLAAIVTYSQDAIFSNDLEGLVTSWNHGAEVLFGYSAGEIIGRPVSLLVPSGRDDVEPQILARAKRGELTENYETIWSRKDESSFVISLTVSPLRDSAGRVIGACRIARDITDRRRAEDLLAAQKSVLELAASGAGIEEVLRVVVRAVRQHSGEQSRASAFLLEPDGLHLRFVVSEGLSDEYTRAVDQFEVGPYSPSCGRAAFIGEPVIVGDVTKDPLWSPYLSLARTHDIAALWSQPLRTVGGKVLGTIAVYHRAPREPAARELDALTLLSQTAALVIERMLESDQRQIVEIALRESERGFRDMANEVRALNEELELRVNKRTADLLSANEQLQGFTYSVAHDLRQQIRGVSSNASILMLDAAHALSNENRDTLDRMVGSAKKLAILVDDLLTHARLGRQEPITLPLDITALAVEAASFLIECGTCRPGTSLKIAPGLEAHGDSSMVRIVLENLLDNACKFSAQSESPSIEVGQIGAEFFVRDNGIGFDMQFVPKLFLPFERLHRESAYTGTGIGLANVKRIVEKHGGEVRAEGKPGEGATFYFNLGE